MSDIPPLVWALVSLAVVVGFMPDFTFASAKAWVLSKLPGSSSGTVNPPPPVPSVSKGETLQVEDLHGEPQKHRALYLCGELAKELATRGIPEEKAKAPLDQLVVLSLEYQGAKL